MLDMPNPIVQIPVVQGAFGSRLATYSTQLPPTSIETIVGHDPRSKGWKKLPNDIEHMYNHLQRATTRQRLDSLTKYIQQRFGDGAIISGAFPAISIAVQNPTPFRPFDVPQGGVGLLDFDLGKRNLRVVVDGLGRASAALDLVELSESAEISDEERDELRKLLDGFAIPCVFYIPAPDREPV